MPTVAVKTISLAFLVILLFEFFIFKFERDGNLKAKDNILIGDMALTKYKGRKNVYEDRLSTLKSACAKYGLDKLPIYDRTIVYNDEYNLAYCPIEKTGSSTWLERLKRFPSGSRRFFYSKHGVSSKALNETVSPRFGFFFVRHPFIRLVSAFRNKVQNRPGWRNWTATIPK